MNTKIVNITEVCDFQGGTQPPKSEWKLEETKGFVRMLQIRDFTQPNKKNIAYVKDKKTLKKCLSDDILIGRYGASIGKILTGLEGAYNVAIMKTIPDEEKLYKKYLFYLLNSISFQSFICNIGDRAAQAGFNKTELERFQFPLPPLSEQKRIAQILDKADALRQKNKQLLAAYDELLKATFLDMFGDPVSNPKGWPLKTLSELSEIVSGVTKGRKLNGKELIELPYMRVANVQDGHLFLDEIKTIEVLPSDYEKYKLIPNDILLTEGGDPDKLGRGAIWNGEIENCIHQNHIFRVRIKDKIINEYYLNSLIGSSYGKNYFLKSAKQTTGIASINSTQLKKFPVILAPIEIQNNYKKVFKNNEAQKTILKQSILQSENLFNALVQKAFKGEL